MSSGPNRNQKQNVLGDFFHQRLPQQIEARPKEKELVAELEKRSQEVAVLNEVNTRLGQELLALQEKLGITPETVIAELENVGDVSPAFHFESGQLEYLDALLTAYDDNNLTQKKMIGRLYSQLTEMETRADALVKDNAFLMDELEGKCRTVLEIYSNGFPQENLAGIYHKLQKEDLQAKNAYYREENDYLVKNFKQLEQRLAQLQESSDLHEKQATTHFDNYKRQTEQLQEALMRVEDLSRINDVLKKKFDEITDENNALEARKYETQTKLVRLDNDLKLARSQLLHAKRTEKEVGFKLEEQVERLTQELESTQKREKECFNKSLSLEKELEVSREALRKSKRDLQQCKRDFEQTLKMLETYELKINNYVKKEEAIDRIAKENRQKIQNAFLERDRAVLKQQQLNKLIENQTAKHKDEIKNLSESYQKIVRSLNEKISSLEEALEEEESTHNQSQATFKSQSEKLRRQITMLRDENAKFMNSLKSSQSDELANRLKDYEQRNESLKRIIQQQERSMKDDTQDKLETIRRLEGQNRQISRQLEKQRAQVRDLSNSNSTMKSKLSIVTKEKDSAVDEIDRLKKQHEIRLASFQTDQSGRAAELQQKLDEAIRREKTVREKAIGMLENYDEAEEKLKYEYESRIKELELENDTLKMKLQAFLVKRK